MPTPGEWDWNLFPEEERSRREKGRPDPTISPEQWQGSSELEQNEAIATYLAQLDVERLAAETAAAAPGIVHHADPDAVPRLPREGEPQQQEPHREKNARVHPACIARKLSKKEMGTCPRARKALNAEWEKLRMLKRPHPTKGTGAWDENNVREASSVRDEARKAGKTVHFGRIFERCHE